jgi:hypothetical protein
VFALPPILLMIGVMARRRTAFWAGVLALFWFSHAVMVAWADAAVKRVFAWASRDRAGAAIVIGRRAQAGLRAKFGKRFGRRNLVHALPVRAFATYN